MISNFAHTTSSVLLNTRVSLVVFVFSPDKRHFSFRHVPNQTYFYEV